MVTENELLQSERYKLNHIQINVLEKNEEGEVLVFGGLYENTISKDVFSDGVIEANLTLWNPESPKRPKGYIIVDTFELGNGKVACVLAERRFTFDVLAMDDSFEEKWRAFYQSLPSVTDIEPVIC